jgi:anti-sigma factor RsiW
MNCAHCLALIETHSLAELARYQHAAILQHVASCPACAQQLGRVQQLEDRLQQLAEPSPPPGFEDLIMQRLLASDPARSIRTLPRSRSADAPESLQAMLVGGALALLTQCVAWLGSPSTGELFSPLLRGGMDALVRMPESGGTALVLALGLTLMLVGLGQSLEPRQSSRAKPRVS